MRTSRFTNEQIAMALRQAEAATPVAEICRKLEITDATFSRWKKKSGGMGVSEVRELRKLKEENRKLKQPVADPWGSSRRSTSGAAGISAPPARGFKSDASGGSIWG